MNRILIFRHHNTHGELAPHVFYTLKTIRSLYGHVILILNNHLKSDDLKTLEPISHKIAVKENCKFEIKGWQGALWEVGWDNLAGYDSLTVMDDSCFGPLFDLEPIYQKMDSLSVDFWSITKHQGKFTKSLWPESYFITFSSKVIRSKIFQAFCDKVRYTKVKSDKNHPHNAQLTKMLTDAGFSFGTYIDPLTTPSSHPASSFYPESLIKKECPFIKIQDFLLFNHPIYLKNLIKAHSRYPVQLIDEHISEILPPNLSLKILDKNFIIPTHQRATMAIDPPIRVALHLHVFYIDVLCKYLRHFQHIRAHLDLYITTDTDDKKKQIISVLSEHRLNHLLKNIYVFNNRGRDVLPWLRISSILNQYDIVGHFHTKKTDRISHWIGDSWQNEIIDSLIQPLEEIFQLFSNYPKLGIVISDMPDYFISVMPGLDAWRLNRTLVDALWLKMNCKKDLQIKELPTPVMPYGTMFWYRPLALKPLFDLELSESDFLPEPLPLDGTMAHAVERLPVYLAWSEGYDFRIAIHADQIKNKFEIFELFSRINQSLDYRVGKAVLSFPKKVYRFLRRTFCFIK